MVARILRLDEVPQPADAADALALALCHAWRGGAAGAGIRRRSLPRSGRGPTPSGSLGARSAG